VVKKGKGGGVGKELWGKNNWEKISKGHGGSTPTRVLQENKNKEVNIGPFCDFQVGEKYTKGRGRGRTKRARGGKDGTFNLKKKQKKRGERRRRLLPGQSPRRGNSPNSSRAEGKKKNG